jgi:hypothetical protein
MDIELPSFQHMLNFICVDAKVIMLCLLFKTPSLFASSGIHLPSAPIAHTQGSSKVSITTKE